MYGGNFMKKKLIGIILISVILTSSLGSIAIAKNDSSNEINDNYFQEEKLEQFDTFASYQNETEVKTTGPIAPVLNLAEITILKGPYIKTFIMRLILSSLRAYFLLPNISFGVQDMTFVVHYKKNVPNMMFFNKFSYNTTVIEDGNEEVFNKKHILVVTGFDGTFGFRRAKIPTLTPAFFRFEGTSEDLLVAS
jgi:hypothetical protein